jgi:methyl-accepting chemotaxis protein
MSFLRLLRIGSRVGLLAGILLAMVLGVCAAAALQWGQATVLSIALAAVVSGTALSTAVVRSITQPLQEAVHAAERLSQGHLSAPLGTDGRDEIASWMRAMETMRSGLSEIVSEVRTNHDSIATGVSHIAVGSAELSRRTGSQAHNVQHTAESLEQLTEVAQHSAQVAGEASELATSTAQHAQRGGQLVADVVVTMDKISESSRRIADIITTIDGIALQTNVLALNAAVEAARAGEEGRGFAVVAEEVRTLAKRSAQAAREVRALVGDTTDRIEAGTHLVQAAGGTIADIVGNVERVAVLIADISTFAEQQGFSIGEVSGAVSEIDVMTLQNAALVEESAAAAETLRILTHRLSAAVERFSL